jgi:hypothetical protein
MDYNKDSYYLQVLNAESERRSFDNLNPDPEISSWNHKKRSSRPIPDFPAEDPACKSHFAKEAPKSVSKQTRRVKSPIEFNSTSLNPWFNQSPKPNAPNYFFLPERKEKSSPKTRNAVNFLGFEALEINNSNNSAGMRFPCQLKYIIAKRLKGKSMEKEKEEGKSMTMNVNRIISEKLGDILSKTRSPSPHLRKFSGAPKNRLQISAAKTLEELLRRSKLPEINEKRQKTYKKFT